MGRFAAGEAPEADAIVADAILRIGGEIEALAVPQLRGVVLGGGYGRGEGGVRESVKCKMESVKCRLSNDLDFFAITDEGADEGSAAPRIAAALEPVSAEWTRNLGIDVDFTVKTPWRLKHDMERLMVQELLHGYADVAGEKGEILFAGLEKREPSALPWMEAARLMMNRGMGLLLAKCKMENVKCKMGSGICANQNEKRKAGVDSEAGESVRDFVNRNINKCILGCGDARLIAAGTYRWRGLDRASALGDALYSKALEWKFRPSAEPVCDWETARAAWLETLDAVMDAGGRQASRRTFKAAARWIVRRKSIGSVRTLALDPVLRVLDGVARAVDGRRAADPELMRDWEIFN